MAPVPEDDSSSVPSLPPPTEVHEKEEETNEPTAPEQQEETSPEEAAVSSMFMALENRSPSSLSINPIQPVKPPAQDTKTKSSPVKPVTVKEETEEENEEEEEEQAARQAAQRAIASRKGSSRRKSSLKSSGKKKGKSKARRVRYADSEDDDSSMMPSDTEDVIDAFLELVGFDLESSTEVNGSFDDRFYERSSRRKKAPKKPTTRAPKKKAPERSPNSSMEVMEGLRCETLGDAAETGTKVITDVGEVLSLCSDEGKVVMKALEAPPASDQDGKSVLSAVLSLADSAALTADELLEKTDSDFLSKSSSFAEQATPVLRAASAQLKYVSDLSSLAQNYDIAKSLSDAKASLGFPDADPQPPSTTMATVPEDTPPEDTLDVNYTLDLNGTNERQESNADSNVTNTSAASASFSTVDHLFETESLDLNLKSTSFVTFKNNAFQFNVRPIKDPAPYPAPNASAGKAAIKRGAKITVTTKEKDKDSALEESKKEVKISQAQDSKLQKTLKDSIASFERMNEKNKEEDEKAKNDAKNGLDKVLEAFQKIASCQSSTSLPTGNAPQENPFLSSISQSFSFWKSKNQAEGNVSPTDESLGTSCATGTNSVVKSETAVTTAPPIDQMEKMEKSVASTEPRPATTVHVITLALTRDEDEKTFVSSSSTNSKYNIVSESVSTIDKTKSPRPDSFDQQETNSLTPSDTGSAFVDFVEPDASDSPPSSPKYTIPKRSKSFTQKDAKSVLNRMSRLQKAMKARLATTKSKTGHGAVKDLNGPVHAPTSVSDKMEKVKSKQGFSAKAKTPTKKTRKVAAARAATPTEKMTKSDAIWTTTPTDKTQKFVATREEGSPTSVQAPIVEPSLSWQEFESQNLFPDVWPQGNSQANKKHSASIEDPFKVTYRNESARLLFTENTESESPSPSPVNDDGYAQPHPEFKAFGRRSLLKALNGTTQGEI